MNFAQPILKYQSLKPPSSELGSMRIEMMEFYLSLALDERDEPLPSDIRLLS
ncbi:MAG: hypothetical protein H8E49_13195 [Gammaproteobacteria bacterium]|nr:hypothetical protein [Gammaproteobacteria bacterium]